MNFSWTKAFMLVVVLVSTVINADTIEVYLSIDTEVTGIEEAHEAGHTLVYYYLDGIDRIEAQLAAKATQKYQQQINELVTQEGLKNLVALNEFQRNQLFLKHLNQTGTDTESLSHAVVTAEDRAAINRALEDLIYADDQGVTKAMLPAIIYKGYLFKHTANLSKVLNEIAFKK